MNRTLLALLVIVVTSSGATVTATSSSQPPAQANASEYPPGLSPEGVADPLALADAHRAGLANVSYTMTTATTFQRPNGTILSESVTTTRVTPDASSFVVVNARTAWNDSQPLGVGTTELAVWANETDAVTARRTSEGAATYRRLPREDAPLEPDAEWSLLYSAFDATNTSVVNEYERGATTLFRVVSTAQPGPTSTYGARSNYSLVAVVDSQGVVRTLQSTYRTTFDGAPVIVSRTMHVSNLGNTTVDRPTWYGQATGNDAENATG